MHLAMPTSSDLLRVTSTIPAQRVCILTLYTNRFFMTLCIKSISQTTGYISPIDDFPIVDSYKIDVLNCTSALPIGLPCQQCFLHSQVPHDVCVVGEPSICVGQRLAKRNTVEYDVECKTCIHAYICICIYILYPHLCKLLRNRAYSLFLKKSHQYSLQGITRPTYSSFRTIIVGLMT